MRSIAPRSKFLMAAGSIERLNAEPSPPPQIEMSGLLSTLNPPRPAAFCKILLTNDAFAPPLRTYCAIACCSLAPRSGYWSRPAPVPGVRQAAALIVPLVSSVPRSAIFPSDPSSVHPESGAAATIQFPPGTTGDTHFGGIFPITRAGPP